MEETELEKRTSNKLYIKLATQIANSKNVEKYGLSKMITNTAMIEKFRNLTKGITRLREFDHERASIIVLDEGGSESPAIKVPFKKPVDSKKIRELDESINWFYKNNNQNNHHELVLNNDNLTLVLKENIEIQLDKYLKILEVAKGRSEYLDPKNQNA
jgi:hypothetical protein